MVVYALLRSVCVCVCVCVCVSLHCLLDLCFSSLSFSCMYIRVQRALLSFVDARSLSRGEIGVGAVRVGLVVFAKIVVFVDVYYVD